MEIANFAARMVFHKEKTNRVGHRQGAPMIGAARERRRRDARLSEEADRRGGGAFVYRIVEAMPERRRGRGACFLSQGSPSRLSRPCRSRHPRATGSSRAPCPETRD